MARIKKNNSIIVENATTIGYEEKPAIKAEAKKGGRAMKAKKQDNAIAANKQQKFSNLSENKQRLLRAACSDAKWDGRAKPFIILEEGKVYPSLGQIRAHGNIAGTCIPVANVTEEALKNITVDYMPVACTTDSFYQKLSNICKDRNTNLTRLSKELGKTQTYLNVMKTQGSYPSVPVLLQIADILKVSLDYLFDREVENR